MIQPTSTETMFQALFTLLSQTQYQGSPLFQTSSRRLPPVANVPAILKPALFMLESEEDVAEQNNGLPIEEHKVAAIALFNNDTSLNTIASTQLNTIRDLVVNQIRSFTLLPDLQTVTAMPPGTQQTLGGIVYHARILGKILKNEGLQNNQGAIVFPISILAGL